VNDRGDEPRRQARCARLVPGHARKVNRLPLG
jgi:hypothetical protein